MAKKGTSKAPAQAPAQAPMQRYGGGQAGFGGGGNILPLIYLFGTPIILGIGYLVVVNPLLKKLGLKKDLEDKELEKLREEVMMSNIWNPSHYQNEGGDTLTIPMAQMYAERLYNATESGFNWFGLGNGTTEDEISAVFSNLGSTGNVSLVSEVYQNMYGTRLVDVLESELNDSDFAQYVINPISNYF